MILGREWLKQNGVRLYFDLGYLRINNTYVRLEEDIHISSLLRLYTVGHELILVYFLYFARFFY
jgi:hypothetical protein